MSLEPGVRLGPYEIVAAVGAGGMGEVFEARDTRLDRRVAVKILPPSLAPSPEARSRFEREAKSVSRLNHPNICALFDLGREGDTDYLVMEYLEGETLADRLARGPLPFAEALRVGGEIAQALAAAHALGVVHRDLKPGNVMLSKAGAKLMDFGLAKSMDAGSGDEGLDGLTAMPTATTPLTAEGSIVGTLFYMAPEQLEGRPADARSDVFAFGAVLHEMITGHRAFAGSSQASVVASILKESPPPLSTFLPTAPAGLVRLTARCLEKDPDDRWQSTADLAHEVRSFAADSGVTSRTDGLHEGGPRRATRREALAWLLVIVLAAVAASAWIATGDREASANRIDEATPVALTLDLPEGTVVRSSGEWAAPVTVSPDGTKIVLGLIEPDGANRLWLRSLDSNQLTPLDGTVRGSRPFWSPDSRSIGFFADGHLQTTEVEGGIPIPIAPAPAGRGGVWTSTGIVFAPGAIGGLVRVPAAGGEVEPVTELDVEADEASHRYPVLLPGERHLVMLVMPAGGARTTGLEAENRLDVVDLETGERRPLVAGVANAAYVGGELYFYRGGSVQARRLDLETMELGDESRVILEPVKYDAPYEFAAFSLSERTLVYEAGEDRGENQLEWFDREGRSLGTLGDVSLQSGPAISPDGTMVAEVRSRNGRSDVWVFDLVDGTERRLTSSGGAFGRAFWSPDGGRVVYTALEGNLMRPHVVATDGGSSELLFEGDGDWSLHDWSPDGRYAVLLEEVGFYRNRLWLYDMEAGGGPTVLVELGEREEALSGRISPDGRWIAYAISQNGRWEIAVSPLGSPSRRWIVTQNGGYEPTWAGTERLYYRTPGNELVQIGLTVDGETLRFGDPEPLFRASLESDLGEWMYDLHPDGDRFLINRRPEAVTRIPVVVEVGWQSKELD